MLMEVSPLDKPPGRDRPVVVRCLGTGDAFGSGGRLQAGFVVESGKVRIALDFGATSLPSLSKLGIPPETINAICISHFHGDHYGGIPFLLRYRQLRSIDDGLVIVGPAGLSDRLDLALRAFFPPSRPGDARTSARLIELRPGESAELYGSQVTAYAAVHRAATEPLALRLMIGGKTIGYSGDSVWTDGVEAAGRGADLFIVEAYEESRSRTHMSVAELRDHLPALGCRQVLLTHMGPAVLNSPPDLPGCVIAQDHLELVVGSE